MYDVKCPYCGEETQINHDDGYGYEEGQLHEQECWKCEKYFAYETIISIDHRPYKADCLNGADHKWKPVRNSHYPDKQRCKDCGKEDNGKFVMPA